MMTNGTVSRREVFGLRMWSWIRFSIISMMTDHPQHAKNTEQPTTINRILQTYYKPNYICQILNCVHVPKLLTLLN